jgi:glucoamylase
MVHWSSDGWVTSIDTPTHDAPLGTHIIDLEVEDIVRGGAVVFTLYWQREQRWEGVDYRIDII